MKLLGRLLDLAVAVLPSELHDRVVVYGSAPMVFAGLKPDVTFDLDLFSDDRSYEALLATGFQEDLDERGLPRIMAAEAVEVVQVWPRVTFADVSAASRVQAGSRGLRVASLEDVLAFKGISARTKDQREAAIIRQALGLDRG